MKKLIKVLSILALVILTNYSFATTKSGPTDDVVLVNGAACCTHDANAKEQTVVNNSQIKTIKVIVKEAWTDKDGNVKEKSTAYVLAPGEQKKLGCTSNCLYPGSTPSTVYTRQIAGAEYL